MMNFKITMVALNLSGKLLPFNGLYTYMVLATYGFIVFDGIDSNGKINKPKT